jgi:predicted metalloendopeptidase
MRTRVLVLIAVLALALSAQAPSGLKSGIHPEDMDTTCKPCTDFWRFVNGNWIDKNPIPASQSSWGSFNVLSAANRERTRTILDGAAAGGDAPGSLRRKMGDFYASCLDTAAIDARALTPLKPDFALIDAVHDVKDLGTALIAFQMMARSAGGPGGGGGASVVGLFRLAASQDQKNPDRVIATVGANAVFSLPDRDYYFRKDAKSENIRAEFLKHVAKMLELSGTPAVDATASAKAVLALETSLAESALSTAEKRDPDKMYHPTDLAGLAALAPNFDWAALFQQAGIAASSAVNTPEPEFLKKFNKLLTETSINDWKAWMRWRAVHLVAGMLPEAIAAEDFHFERGVLNGVEKQLPRWETCAQVVDRDLGEALGQAYVEKYFPPAAKKRMAELVENLREAMRDKIQQSDWMQPATKRNAVAKLNALQVKIGYPDAWNTYTDVAIDRSKFFENVRSTWTAADRMMFAKVGKPVNRIEWGMTPPTVNAYSNSAKVEIVFPAGILQPPFFDMGADDAANYGAIGAVIGHEMGHQFDDGGSKFDSKGALNNWWTAEDRKEFDKRTSCVVEEFNTLDVGDGLRHNGKLVLGEALGDLNGVNIAYAAYHRTLAGKPEPPSMDGYTADQRFFIAFARIWGVNMRPDALRVLLNTNPHPYGRFRAIGTLQNVPEFHKAFQCKDGDVMVRPAARQCKIW